MKVEITGGSLTSSRGFMPHKNELPDVESDALADLIRPAVINNTVISVCASKTGDRGITLLFANGTELSVCYSAQEGAFFLDAQRRYDQ